MLEKKDVLITGAAGFIGASLTRKLIKEGSRIHILIKKTTNTWRVKDILDRVVTHNVDLNNLEGLQKLTKKIKPKVIFHLSAHGNYPSQEDLHEMIKTNITGTANLLLSLADINYECFVNTGTSSEYGFKEKPMKETDLLEPVSYYAATKASASLICQVFAKEFKKPIVTLRPFSVYGPWEEGSRLIPTVINSILKDKQINLTAGKEKRDFIYIDDLVDAYLKAARTGLSGEIINIGSGKQFSTREVVEIITSLIKKGAKINYGAYKPRIWDTDFWLADKRKAKKLLGWKPKFNIKEGLTQTIKWFEQNLKYY